jgi:hypothetical protein
MELLKRNGLKISEKEGGVFLKRFTKAFKEAFVKRVLAEEPH